MMRVTTNDAEVFASHAFRNLPIHALSFDDVEDIRAALQLIVDAVARRAANGGVRHG